MDTEKSHDYRSVPTGAGGGFVCVMSRSRAGWPDASAMWITAAGWTAAGLRRFGAAHAELPDGQLGVDDLLGLTDNRKPKEEGLGHPRFRRLAPAGVVTGAKDVQRLKMAVRFNRKSRHRVIPGATLVWQHHDLFNHAGRLLADANQVPVMSYVHAPVVWEARRWGVRRSGWGGVAEHLGERRQLSASDLVACVSDEVAEQLTRMGVLERRILVCPMAVDLDLFATEHRPAQAENRPLVIGWTGSFRRFHGLEELVDAFALVHAAVPQTRLLLVGDGATRPAIKSRCKELGLERVVDMPGGVAFRLIPALLAQMDICVVTARADEPFHYSPLKLREYLASARPVIGPDVGEVRRILPREGVGLVYRRGSPRDLARALVALLEAPVLRRRMGDAGRLWVQRTGTWDVQLERCVSALVSLGPAGRQRNWARRL